MLKKEELLKAAALSISAHNVQPFRLSFISDDRIDIHVDFKRLLPIGDAHCKDLRQSLGAFIETLQLHLGKMNWGVKLLEVQEHPQRGEPMAQLQLQTSTHSDPLALYLSERFSYRGKFFAKKDIPEKILHGEGFTLEFLTERQDLKDIAKIYDDVNYQFLTLPGYIEELYSWMRFSPNHPRWSVDGLNADSMSLKGLEAWGASIILKAKLFRALGRWGLAKPLVSEAAQIQSASALAVILSPSNNDVEKGRAFMRGWLALTGKSLFGAPLSLLTDDLNALSKVAAKIQTKGQYIVNILRVGPLPKNYQRPVPARLAENDLEWRK